MARPLDWSALQALLAAADAGSLTAAARATGLSQPTLSRRIAGLERELGVTLFARGTRGLTPTDEGARLIAHAREMEAAAARLSLDAAGASQRIEGVVRVTASRVVATYHLPPILARLLDEEPGLEIELVASDQTDNLLRREADIAVRMYRPDQAEVITRRMTEFRLGLYAAPTYLARHGRPETPDDLRRHRFVDYDRSELIRRGFAEHGVHAARAMMRLRTDDQIAYWRSVIAGAGIGVGQIAVAAAEPGVERILPELPMPRLPVWLTAHAALRSSARVRRVYDALAEGLARLDREPVAG